MKEFPIDDILNSLDGMERAAMPQPLRGRILASLPAGRRGTVMLRRPAVWLMAAGVAALLGLNVAALLAARSAESRHSAAKEDNPVAAEYFAPAPSI